MASSPEPIGDDEHASAGDPLRFPFPKKLPPGRFLVGGVDWSWSPAHSRTDVYVGWLSRRQGRLFVWVKDPYAFEYGEKPRYQPYCSVRTSADETPAAVVRRALIFAWSGEVKRSGLDAPHETTALGLLSGQKLKSAIAEVWPRR
jgi:hypothetical protein